MAEKRKYDSTVARIAGNIASGYVTNRGLPDHEVQKVVVGAVVLARAIVAEVERTDLKVEG